MKLLLSLLLMIPVSSFAQIFFDFEQGLPASWTQDPQDRWGVSDISPLSGHFSLHHIYDNPEGGHDRISFSPGTICWSCATLSWQFILRHGYTPSSVNNWAIFLAADGSASRMMPGSNIRTIAAGVNLTGNDDLLKLWYLHDGTTETLLTTDYNWQESTGTSAATLKITRSPSGDWQVFLDTSDVGSHFFLVGEVVFPDTFPARTYGIYYEYSSSRDRLLWIDDIHLDGVYVQDTSPPQVKDYRFPSQAQVVITFNEEISVEEALFSVDHNIGEPTLINFLKEDSLLLSFPHDFFEDTIYSLHITGVQDLTGNSITDTLLKIYYHRPHYLEIQINEIMADPTPVMGLPDAEYIELYNPTKQRIWLDHCRMIFGEATKELPLADLPAGSYLILTDRKHSSLLAPYGHILALTNMPALVNAGMALTLTDSAGRVLSHITYDTEWYGDPYKAEGGWSLEQIDPAHPCPRKSNWQAAVAYPGGTPGMKNSVYADNPDDIPAEITHLFLTDNHTLRMIFSEPYDPATTTDPRNFLADHEAGSPPQTRLFPPDFQTVDLIYDHPFRTGIIYTLTIKNIRDCSGNSVILTGHDRFARTLPPDSTDLVINELLYNPPPMGVDFVEIYNRSQKVIDLSNVFLARRDEDMFNPTEFVRISTLTEPFFPEEYRVVTIDPQSVLDEFFSSDPKVFLRADHLPALPDDKGNILITDSNFHVIDEFHYDDDMQFPLLRETEGVSLERIDPDGSTRDRLNWHSASSDRGYGTPGLQNSQYHDGTAGDLHISTEPEIVSPDNDGYHDVLHIKYSFDEPGYVATVMIFNADGVLVRTLVNNYLLGRQGDIIWNGLDTEEKRPPTGIYLILIKVFNLRGEVKKYKKTCVITGRKG